MKYINTFENFLIESSASSLHATKITNAIFKIDVVPSSKTEVEFTITTKDIEIGPSYIDIKDDEWDNVNYAKVLPFTSKLEQEVKKYLNIDHKDTSDRLVKGRETILANIKKMLDSDTDALELFGAETYNGWEYDNDNLADTTNDYDTSGVLATALYVIAKAETYMDWHKRK